MWYHGQDRGSISVVVGGRGEKMCGATVARVEVRSKVVWCHGQGNRGVKVCGAMIRVIEE